MRAVVYILLLVLASPLFAEVYRSVDAQGNPVFSDKPIPGAVKVETRPVPSITLRGTEKKQLPDTSSSKATEEEKPTRYSKLKISMPADDQALRDNAGNVTVDVIVEPALNTKQGHRLGVILDGHLLPETWSGTRAQLVNLDRGTHTLQAVILNKSGKTLIRSKSITFHLLRFSRLFR